MINKLARFFRNALSRESSAKVSLAEELRVQLEYLNIELTRFPERLAWSTHIEPGLDKALVPHLILQPLFENAIKHGVARTSAPVELQFGAVRRSGQLILTLQNGAKEAKGATHRARPARVSGSRTSRVVSRISMERKLACRPRSGRDVSRSSCRRSN